MPMQSCCFTYCVLTFSLPSPSQSRKVPIRTIATTTATAAKTSLKKVKSCRFKVVTYLYHLVQFVNVGNFLCSWILKDLRESLSWVHVLYNTWMKAFSRRSRAVTAKICTKILSCARAELLFCPFDLFLFNRSRWRRRRRCLSSRP